MENKLAVDTAQRRHRAVGSRVRVGPKPGCGAEPEIRVMKSGDRIESIVIHCSCGEEITVICGYDENPQP